MLQLTVLAMVMGLVAVLYGAAGQAGGSGFVAVMTFAHFQAGEIRATAFALNIVAAAYATLQIHRARLADWRLLGLLLISSVPAALLGGFAPLHGHLYYVVTGVVLFGIAGLMAGRRIVAVSGPVGLATALAVGATTGLASGLTGVGGGIFLSSILILLGKASPKDVLALSPPFILVNSAAALVGIMAAGQPLPRQALGLSGAVLLGSVLGSAIGLRWMSEKAIRVVLVLILLAGGIQMLIRATL